MEHRINHLNYSLPHKRFNRFKKWWSNPLVILPVVRSAINEILDHPTTTNDVECANSHLPTIGALGINRACAEWTKKALDSEARFREEIRIFKERNLLCTPKRGGGKLYKRRPHVHDPTDLGGVDDV